MIGPAAGERWRLVIDTATRQSTVALGDGARPVAESRRVSQHRHGTLLLEQIDEVLDSAGVDRTAVSAIAVGTGPGSFTGLRVGLATAKTLAYGLGCPLLGISTATALARAVQAVDGQARHAVMLPAGAHDHYLVPAGGEPVLVPVGRDLGEMLAGAPAIAIDMPVDDLGPEAASRGRAALDGLGAALLAIAAERLASGESDDVSELVPAYVALPRGISPAVEGMAWSPDLR